jgi:hypothetical protein
LPGVLRAAGPSPEVAEAAVLAAWRHVAGAGLKDHAVPLRLVERTLVVAVADAVWQKQLASMSGQLLFRTNSILGQPLVSWIEFLIDPAISKVRTEPKPSQDVPDNEIPLELWSAANAIHDPHLRKSFLRAALGSLKRGESQVKDQEDTTD